MLIDEVEELKDIADEAALIAKLSFSKLSLFATVLRNRSHFFLVFSIDFFPFNARKSLETETDLLTLSLKNI